MNGVVNSADALLALRASMGLVTLTPAQIERGDMNGDGEVTSSDALVILRMSMSLGKSAPRMKE